MANNPVVIRPMKVILDFILLMCVGFPILFLYLWGKSYKRGFFCEDDSIRHPFHTSTVPSISLYFIGMGVNGITMILTEYLNQPPEPKQYQFMGLRIPAWFYNLYCVVGVFLFGTACSQLSTDVMKYSIGRLRPHFYTMCLPDVDCSLPQNRHLYHEDFRCTNEEYLGNKRLMKEMRLSFPSGHSSFSMFTMVYFAIYVQRRMTWNGSKLLKHTLQFLAVLFAIFVGMTRISDYKHHWSDVLCGLLFGMCASIITTTVCGRFNETKTKKGVYSDARFFSTLYSSTYEERLPLKRDDEMANLNGNRTQRINV